MFNMFGMLAKSLTIAAAVLVAAITAVLATVVLQTWREHEGFLAREQRAEQELAQARIELREKELYLRRVLEDPVFFERVVREKLGYVRPDETLFLFPEEATQPIPTPPQ